MLIITIGGAPGSGKSTIGKMLAAQLHIPYFSMGDIRRTYATERGLSLAELNQQSETDPTTDSLVDKQQEQLPEEYEAFVLDSRLGFYFLPQSIKLFVTVDRKTAAQRIHAAGRKSEQWSTIEEGVASLKAREATDHFRYRKYYNIDPSDIGHYDLVIDSTEKTPEQLLEQVMEFLRKKKIIDTSTEEMR